MFKENTVPLLGRWNYAKDLVEDFNNNPEKYAAIRASMKGYFEGLKARNIDDQKLYDATYNKITPLAISMQILLLPISVFGAIHCGLFYFCIKRFVESKFRRPVFWGSTKLMMMLILGILNLSLLFLLPPYIGMLGAVAYFLFIPFAGLIFHNGLSFIKRIASRRNIRSINVSDILKERLTLINKLNEITNG